MHVVNREDIVHKGCGGKIRERVYDDPERSKMREDRLKELFATGMIDMAELEKRLANKPANKSTLECRHCGAESDLIPHGPSEEKVYATVDTIDASAYGGRLL